MRFFKVGTETSRSSQKWDLLPLIYGILTQILDMLVMADLAIDFIFTILAQLRYFRNFAPSGSISQFHHSKDVSRRDKQIFRVRSSRQLDSFMPFWTFLDRYINIRFVPFRFHDFFAEIASNTNRQYELVVLCQFREFFPPTFQ